MSVTAVRQQAAPPESVAERLLSFGPLPIVTIALVTGFSLAVVVTADLSRLWLFPGVFVLGGGTLLWFSSKTAWRFFKH
jgi:hypothetical protein